VIRFLFLEGKSHNKIKERLDAVYGDSSSSMATVKNWFNSSFNEVERAPKKVSSAGKVMATVFCDSQRVIHVDYLEEGKNCWS